MASGHICPSGSTSVESWPLFAGRGAAVRVVDSGTYGRVRHEWPCCGTVVVQFLRDPGSAETYSDRLSLVEITTPRYRASYSIPCIGSDWSLHLPCGHVAGEGCDCELIALEAEAV